MEEKHQLLRYFFSFYSDYVALLMRFISYNKVSTNLKKKHVLSSLPMLEFSFYSRLWNTDCEHCRKTIVINKSQSVLH